MAKSVVLRCDKCGTWDSEKVRVITTPVAGPKRDLCPNCRANVLVAAGVPDDKAQEYVKHFDGRRTTRGPAPRLDATPTPEAAEEEHTAHRPVDPATMDQRAEQALQAAFGPDDPPADDQATTEQASAEEPTEDAATSGNGSETTAQPPGEPSTATTSTEETGTGRGRGGRRRS